MQARPLLPHRRSGGASSMLAWGHWCGERGGTACASAPTSLCMHTWAAARCHGHGSGPGRMTSHAYTGHRCQACP